MQPRIEREAFLARYPISTGRYRRGKNQIPASGGHGAGDHEKGVLREERVAERLLTSAGDSRHKPVRIRYGHRFDEADTRGITNRRAGEHMRHRVERFEAPVHGDFEDCRRRVEKLHAMEAEG